MTRKTDTKTIAQPTELMARLEEIRETKIGTLTDDEVLRLLASRKELEEEYRAYEAAREAEEKIAALRKEYDSVAEELTELNGRITSDKSDEDLLKLIKERKDLEAKLGVLSQKLDMDSGGDNIGMSRETETSVAEDQEPEVVFESAEPEESEAETQERPEEQQEERKEEQSAGNGRGEESIIPASEAVSREEFGKEAIVIDPLQDSGEFDHYLDQMRSNPNSLGTVLQGLPAAAKRNKTFMLSVAAIDPAYAMHYADTVLKKDEDFNVRVAGIKNVRNTGNALAEMLPEMRTATVVFAGVKQDYRNIRFANPGMAEYEEMLSTAKRGALAKVKELKEGADLQFIIPKPLQKDKEFMAEAEKLASPKKKSQPTEAVATEAEGAEPVEVAEGAESVEAKEEGSAKEAQPAGTSKKGPWSIRHSGQ